MAFSLYFEIISIAQHTANLQNEYSEYNWFNYPMFKDKLLQNEPKYSVFFYIFSKMARYHGIIISLDVYWLSCKKDLQGVPSIFTHLWFHFFYFSDRPIKNTRFAIKNQMDIKLEWTLIGTKFQKSFHKITQFLEFCKYQGGSIQVRPFGFLLHI